MDTVENARIKLECKLEELEDLQKRFPSYKDKEYGRIVHRDPPSLLMKIEELEDEIEQLKKEDKMGELVNENKIGVTKASEVEKDVQQNFQGECTEVGLYLAMGRQAEREGYPEVAVSLEKFAWEEAQHAAHFAELNGLISPSTKENLEKMLAGETMANKGKRESAVKSKEKGIDPAHDFFDESSRDEGRHARALEGLLKRYFK